MGLWLWLRRSHRPWFWSGRRYGCIRTPFRCANRRTRLGWIRASFGRANSLAWRGWIIRSFGRANRRARFGFRRFAYSSLCRSGTRGPCGGSTRGFLFAGPDFRGRRYRNRDPNLFGNYYNFRRGAAEVNEGTALLEISRRCAHKNNCAPHR